MPVMLKRPASASVPVPQQAGSSVVVTLPVAQAASKPEWYSSGDGKVQLPMYLVTAAKLVNAEDVVSEPPLQAYICPGVRTPLLNSSRGSLQSDAP